MTFFLWMVSIVLVVGGIYFLLMKKWLMAALVLALGLVIGPLGVSLIK